MRCANELLPCDAAMGVTREELRHDRWDNRLTVRHQYDASLEPGIIHLRELQEKVVDLRDEHHIWDGKHRGSVFQSAPLLEAVPWVLLAPIGRHNVEARQARRVDARPRRHRGALERG